MIDSALLQPGRYIESEDADVAAFAPRSIDGAADAAERARRLYYAVRDGIAYDPYCDLSRDESYSARGTLTLGRGNCIGKAALMCAVARAVGIPSRFGLADVRNHLATPRFLALTGTSIFIHGYTEIFVEGRWVKVTPTFDLPLCRKFNVHPLDFDGRSDALFHEFDTRNRRHMEYLAYRGVYADIPVKDVQVALQAAYPRLWEHNRSGGMHDFAAEIGEDREESP